MSILKAFIICPKDESWYVLQHGETRGQAQMQVAVRYGWEFIDLKAKRLPDCDGLAFTFRRAALAGFHYEDESGQPETEAEFTNDCTCPVCERLRRFHT